MDWDVVIAGGGPAGMTAAIYSARAGFRTIVLDPLGGGGQASVTDVIHNYPGFPEGVSGAELMDLMAKQAKAFGAVIEYDSVVSIVHGNKAGQAHKVNVSSRQPGTCPSVDAYSQLDLGPSADTNADTHVVTFDAHESAPGTAGFTVNCESSARTAKAVIYAAGTAPRKLDVPGEEAYIGRGVSFCATCDGALYKDKVVAVVGGGDSALAEADFLTRFAREVMLIHRRDEFRAGQASVRRIEANPKVRRLMSSVVEEVKGDEFLRSIAVRDIKTRELRDVMVDGLFLYVGSDPNSAPVQGLVDLSDGGYIVTDEEMKTKTPGLYAAGDVRTKTFRQVATAVGDGAMAAWSAERYLLGHLE